ncbi:toll-like receptor 2 [Patella vulgata]|uniref:toll-like receptor 2 n=1 Tax=Patella vulgata TaxID=6465 RepID=UPI00217FB482|nr:toll-like receptor 2 [Patella vulgata]
MKAFDSCNKLETLDLSKSSFEYKTETYFDGLLAGLTNLKELNLSGTGIGFLPTVIPKVMNQLETLDVSHNQISWWKREYFSNLTSLRKLIMASNQIDTIHSSSFPAGRIQSLSTVDLSYNPYSCSCENLLWFSKLLKTKYATNKFKNFPKGYLCSAPSAWEGRMVIKTPISDRYCLLTPVISLIITSVSVGLLLLIFTISMVYRYRWHLRYFVYMLRYYHIRFQRLVHDGCDYRFDIYLSCSEEDVDFILENILPRLEGELNLRVFIPQRDGIGNKIDGIIENMDASRRVILFLSDTFAADHYCEFETSLAYERVLNERRDLMIVILLEELKVVNVTKTIHRVLNVEEYIPWDGSEQGVDMFWLRLIKHLDSPDEPRP